MRTRSARGSDARVGDLMSLDYIEHEGIRILYLDLEGVMGAAEKIEEIRRLNLLIRECPEAGVLVLINLASFMPGRGFMDFATDSLVERAGKIRKAAYIGVDKRNKKLFEYYDAFNKRVVDRKVFEDRCDALSWLIEI
jgi:hypothetical protein